MSTANYMQERREWLNTKFDSFTAGDISRDAFIDQIAKTVVQSYHNGAKAEAAKRKKAKGRAAAKTTAQG